jgi:membrane protein YdbS with pleckstrin-like domain
MTSLGPIPEPARSSDAAILALTRPHPHLLFLYTAYSLAGLVLAPAVFLPLYFKYHTLRYRLDEQGISASWGILFRREIHLTYKRIQDIHVRRNLLERWLGIATVEIQTASGSSSAELALEGMQDWEGVRDFLYRRMRGHELAGEPGTAPETAGAAARDGADEVVRLLREIRAEVEGARRALEARS